MNGEHNIAGLLRQLRDDTTTLLREEVVLAKTEVREIAKRSLRQVVLLTVGGLIAASAGLLALMALAFLIADMFERRGTEPGMAGFLGFLIVSLIVGGIGGVLISKALKHLGNESITPKRTVQSLREDKQWAQRKIS